MARKLQSTRTFAFRPPAPIQKKPVDNFKDLTVVFSNRSLASLWRQVATLSLTENLELPWLKSNLGPLASPAWVVALKLVTAYVNEHELKTTVQTLNIEQGKDEPVEVAPEEEDTGAPPPPPPPPPPRPVSRGARSRDGESDKRSVAAAVLVDREPKTLAEAIQRGKFPGAFSVRVEQFAKEEGLDEVHVGDPAADAPEDK
jgi:hypothetical protein